jgi:4-diphosphocytidyl-2-C-methyl-D-erythritol kinase
MRVARVQAQAKVNLFLFVMAPQPSGYHDLITLFQRIDLADEIVIRVGGSKKTLDASGPAMPPAGLGPVERNLAYRAAEAFAARIGGEFPRGFSIELTKHIPVGAGLGGGSADAAGVLRALNAIAPRPLSSEDLLNVAGKLGSDVPFLASSYTRAAGSGRGDELRDWSDFPEPNPAEMLILVPPFGIATADAYGWLDKDRDAGLVDYEPIDGSAFTEGSGRAPGSVKEVTLKPSTRSTASALGDLGGNSFEPVVERRHPELRVLRERLLEKGAEMARLAGSGSCVFGIFGDRTPMPEDLAVDARVIATRTSSRVVQVEVLE